MAKERDRESRRDALLRENERLRTALTAMRSAKRYTAIAAVSKQAVIWGLGGLFTWLSVRELAGQVTVVDAAVDMCASLSDALAELAPNWIVQIVTLVMVSVSVVLVRRTRANNRKLVKRAAQATRRLEELTDPHRSSSKLGEDGDSHKDDVL